MMGKVNETTLKEDREKRIFSSQLYNFEKRPEQLPIVYRDEYNIKLFGLERIHPFDAGKWGNVIQMLKTKNLLDDELITKPIEATMSDLRVVHTCGYLKSLNWSIKVAQITEVPPAAFVPNFILQRKLLRPFRFQTSGSIVGGKLAIEQGWSINVGGGFHHCSGSSGGGFCAYADITLAIRYVLANFEHIQKVLIIDLDAHQGNGYERDFRGEENIYILDIYNKYIYPKDEFAKQAIRRKVELTAFTEDAEYLEKVTVNVEGALNEFQPQFIIFNAGTDILKGDPLGLLCISKRAVIERDEIVWKKVRSRNIPILMLTSGGYQRCSAAVIADSISNLHHKGLIHLKSTS